MNFFIETYGCQMNVADSNNIVDLLKEKGYNELTADESKTETIDIIIINTCSVRESAENRVWARIGAYKYYKQTSNKNLITIIMGCMAQKEEDRIYKKFPHVNLVIGTYNQEKIHFYIEAITQSKNPYYHVNNTDMDEYSFLQNRPDEKKPFKAFVNIIHGCNNFCAYCIVPYTRGREKSRPHVEIIENITTLVTEGVREITLLGQNVNSYGQDSDDISFLELLTKINSIIGIERIRFLTSHPKDFTVELIKGLSTLDKICPNFHLPLQSGSDRILRLMNRKYTLADYRKKIEAIKKHFPDYTLSTDLLVGFPEETDKDFAETMKAVEEFQFDEAFMFKYSPRPKTKSFTDKDTVSEKIKIQRLTILIERVRIIAAAKNKKFIGREYDVFVEKITKKDNSQVFGRTFNHKEVILPGTKADIGKSIRARLIKSNGHLFWGEII